MTITIFYSWQSDTPSKTNHRFIKGALESAVKQLVEDGHVEEAPRVDHDTKGVHGDPDVFPTILQKIAICDVFIADVTIVASTPDGKNIPNPNVLLELGYAYKVAGSGRIIKIMNESYGDPSKGLPFDLAHKRWPYIYSLPADTAKPKREKIKETVAKDLAEFIRLILENEGSKDGAGQLADIKVGFDKLEITADLHKYSLKLSVKWIGPRDQDFFNISLLWPKAIKITKMVGFERGNEENINGILYEELSLFVDKRLWPHKTINCIGGKAAAHIEYVFDHETFWNLKPETQKLFYKFYSQEWPPIEGEVSFQELNIF
ncbi:MAG: hypothetical protein JW786_04135 [Desulfobacterales bacterium]|nr:hypothetical protein [Desulfobacterales bacterium]